MTGEIDLIRRSSQYAINHIINTRNKAVIAYTNYKKRGVRNV